MDTIVVTGADGFLGSHFVQYLSQQGVEVYALILPNSSRRHRIEQIKNIHIVEDRLQEWGRILPKLPVSPCAFVHLAWDGVAPETRDATDVQVGNIPLCLQAVRLAGAIRAQRFILPGSTMEYANNESEVNGKACPSPHNLYGAAKVSARYLCQALCEELGIAYISAVITGIYAADRKDSNIIYYAITSLLQKKKPSFTKLEQRWDYVHIEDVVRALYLISTKGKASAFYAIGHGDNWPLSKYIYKIRDLIDSSLPLGIGDIPYKGGKPPSSCVDLSSLRNDTGFEPQISFDQGIREIIAQIAKEQAI